MYIMYNYATEPANGSTWKNLVNSCIYTFLFNILYPLSITYLTFWAANRGSTGHLEFSQVSRNATRRFDFTPV